MKIKLFGKEIFEFKKSSGEFLYNTAVDKITASKFLIDFYKDTGQNGRMMFESYISIEVAAMPSGSVVGTLRHDKKVEKKKEEKLEEKIQITPKDAFELKLLNDDTFILKTEPEYIDEQLATFKEKLSMVKNQEADWNYGTTEIGSIISRFENRKKYAAHDEFYKEFPYTTTTKIMGMVKIHDHLKMGEVSQFMADLPKEAVEVMKRYTKETESLCDKKPVFYIIANKKDFQKTESRRDPILLAQSPFGHFWQILGAWDEEMLLLEEL